MINFERTPGRSLILMEDDPKIFAELSQLTVAVREATDTGYPVQTESFWFKNNIGGMNLTVSQGNTVVPKDGKLVRVEPIPTGVLTEAAALTAADIEVTRLETVPPGLLTARELSMKADMFDRMQGVSQERVRQEYADVILGLGGVAVLGGENIGLRIAGGLFESFSTVEEE